MRARTTTRTELKRSVTFPIQNIGTAAPLMDIPLFLASPYPTILIHLMCSNERDLFSSHVGEFLGQVEYDK